MKGTHHQSQASGGLPVPVYEDTGTEVGVTAIPDGGSRGSYRLSADIKEARNDCPRAIRWTVIETETRKTITQSEWYALSKSAEGEAKQRQRSAEKVVTLRVEPSDPTKAYLRAVQGFKGNIDIQAEIAERDVSKEGSK